MTESSAAQTPVLQAEDVIQVPTGAIHLYAKGADIQDLITDATTDAEIDELGALLTEQIQETYTDPETDEHTDVAIEGVADILAMYRDELREDVREQLTQERETAAASRAHRDDLVRRIHSWNAGDSDRSIGKLAGTSHTEIRRIRNNT